MPDPTDLLRQGGIVMIPILLLSCVLYERCLQLLVYLFRAQRWLRRHGAARFSSRLELQTQQTEVEQVFAVQREWIAILIAAAPLLGLLGTVMGMVQTFESLSAHHGGGSVEGLARGISMALVTTEAGLAVAIPAVLMIYYAERQLQKGLQAFARLDARLLGAPAQ